MSRPEEQGGKPPGNFNLLSFQEDSVDGQLVLIVRWTPSKDAEVYTVYVNGEVAWTGPERYAALEGLANQTISVSVSASNQFGDYTTEVEWLTVPAMSEASVEVALGKELPSPEEAQAVWNALYVRYGNLDVVVDHYEGWLHSYPVAKERLSRLKQGKGRVLRYPKGTLPKGKAK